MNRSHILVVLFMVLMPSIVLSVDFAFVQNEGDNYRIVSTVYEDVRENDILIYSTEILNRIAVSIYSSSESGADIGAVYQISEKQTDGTGYLWNNEETAYFHRDRKGLYSGLMQDSAIPSVRNIPYFPEGDIQPGHRWTSFAEEVHDLKHFFGIDYRLSIPFRVFYTYEGSFEKDGRVFDKILINYNFLFNEDPLVSALEHPEWGEIFPEKITGSFVQEYIWSREEGRPANVEDRFEYRYDLNNGMSYTFSGISYGEVIYSEDMNKEKMVEAINEDLAEEGIDDVAVTAEEQGVRLTIEDIRFMPDSPVLEESEIFKLERISEILLKYRDRDILVTGHTARFGTEESCQILSEQRASAVAGYLLENGIRDETEIVTRGFGSTMPVGDNSTEEGQRMNRRVEITILEN